VPIVAELPTCQNIWEDLAPPLRIIPKPDDVVRVEAIWKIKLTDRYLSVFEGHLLIKAHLVSKIESKYSPISRNLARLNTRWYAGARPL